MPKPQSSQASSIFADRSSRSSLDGSPEIVTVATALCELLGKRVSDISPGALVTMGKITAGPLAAILGDRSSFGVMLAAKMANPAGSILFHLDGDAVNKWVDRLLGGDGSASQPRSFSSVDTRLCRLLLEQALGTFAQSLYDMGHNPGLELEVIASDPAKIQALRHIQSVVAIEVLVGAATWTITLRILIPEAIGTSLRDTIAKEKAADTESPVDRNWVSLIEQQVAQTAVEVCAVLSISTVDLGDVARWTVGQVLPLSATKGALVSLESADTPLAMCELGRHADRLVLRIWSTAEQDIQSQEAEPGSAVSLGQAHTHMLTSIS